MHTANVALNSGFERDTEGYNNFVKNYNRALQEIKSESRLKSPVSSPSSPVSPSSNSSCIYKLNDQITVIKSDNKKKTVYPITIGEPRELNSGDELRLVTDEAEFQRGGRKRKSRKNRYTKNSRRTKHSRRTRHSRRTKRTRRNK